MMNAYQNLVGRPEGKRSRERPRHRWRGNVKLHLEEIDFEGVDCLHMASVVNTVMKLCVP